MIDFSSNLHPDPPPRHIIDAAAAGILESTAYPEPSSESLKTAIAARLGLRLSPDHILCGAGSSSLLYQVWSVLSPRTVYLPVPCFSEFPYAARSLIGARVVEVPAENVDFSEAPRGSCLVLSNPVNPTGEHFSQDIVLDWARRMKSAGGWMIVDEAYADFLDDGPAIWSADTLETLPLIVLRSPLKFFTMPGLRAGYAILPADLAARVESSVPPWPLSCPAIRAVSAAFAIDPAEIFSRRRRLRNWADTFLRALRTIPDISVYPSAVHYFLIRLPRSGPDGFEIANSLAAAQVWVRTAAGIPGIDPWHIRVSTRYPEENGKLVSALKKIYSKEPSLS